jgi:hypothetical protein
MKSNGKQIAGQKPPRSVIQLIWGVALVLAGLGVFYRIPQVMPKIQSFQQFSSAIGFIRFCFYFMGLILIGGGLKKIISHFKESKPNDRNEK